MIVRPYSAGDDKALAAFNSRMAAGGVPMVFGGSDIASSAGLRTRQNYLLVDADEEVHAAYGIRKDCFWLRGSSETLDYYAAPISEGRVNPALAVSGVQILFDAVRRAPNLYGLGGGSLDNDSPRLVVRAGWSAQPVPFLFRIENAARFLREWPKLRKAVVGPLAAMLAATGIGGMATMAIHTAQRVRYSALRPKLSRVDSVPVPDLNGVADEVWERSKNDYSLVGYRDNAHVSLLFPENLRNLRRVAVRRNGEYIGWAIVADKVSAWRRHFGGLNVGVIIDAFGKPDDANEIVGAAIDELRDLRPDVVLTNQNHPQWATAFLRNGFIEGANTFNFLASKQLVGKLAPFKECLMRAHLTRADGDGPSYLMGSSE